MSATPFLAGGVASMRNATSQRYAQTIITRLDARLASVELVGWPSLEQSLRDEIAAAVAAARAMGYRVSPPTAPVRKADAPPRQPQTRQLTCGVCGLMRPREGSVVLHRAGRRVMACPPCAGLR